MAIQINKVATHKGIEWIRQSWQLFKQQSGLWMQTMFFITGIGIFGQILGQISMLIPLLYALVQPFLMAGIYHMAFKAKNGVNSKFNDVFIAFKDLRSRRVLLQIALITILVSLMVSSLVGDNLMALSEGVSPDPGMALALLVLGFVYLMLFFYAVPIAYFFHEQNLLHILKSSFSACWQNAFPLTVFGVISSGLFLLTLPTMLLGLFIVLPWLSIGFYLSFSDLFGHDLPPDDGFDDKDRNDDVTIVV